jgi:tetratricopeptide (TPR) repeat protein
MAFADKETVLGDFENAEFDYFGTKSLFYRKDGKYFVRTQGPEGKLGDFQVTHTFGWYPLQQYLIPFPGGAMQCLPMAWDVEQKRWYHLYPDRPLAPGDWLYWTNQSQNWNGMCAECHSTGLKKNYDFNTDSYNTSWAEINVGCEACHGPASGHVAWANMPDMGRPQLKNAGLTVQTRGMTSKQQIELCAPCHSRRISLDDNIHNHSDFLDYGIPQLLSDGMYYPDGQILDEVYVYGSFMQSKMYARDVRCADCHDQHSTRRIQEGNDLCLQCHKSAIYDTVDHHFHKKKGEKGEPLKDAGGNILFAVGSGSRCEQCHMPGRMYMGIDYRPDHGFRIPRPDLTRTIDSPNPCNRCHQDKPPQWAVNELEKRYGPKKRFHYGTVLDKGRRNSPGALNDLADLANDRLYSPIVRATALSLLASCDRKKSRPLFLRAFSDEEALIRHTAVRYFAEPDPVKRLKLFGPLLYDPVRAVRIEAARALVTVPEASMSHGIRKQFKAAFTGYCQAMDRTSDFSASCYNLGNINAEQNRNDTAESYYKRAIRIDGQFYPARMNLATLYSRQGKNRQAEKLLRETVSVHPDRYEAIYHLGLLLAEMKQYAAAADYLLKAAKGMPGNARLHYNLGLLMQKLRRDTDAETALKKAVSMEPEHPDYLYAMTVFYLQRHQLTKARNHAEKLAKSEKYRSVGEQLLKTIKTNRQPAM